MGKNHLNQITIIHSSQLITQFLEWLSNVIQRPNARKEYLTVTHQYGKIIKM